MWGDGREAIRAGEVREVTGSGLGRDQKNAEEKCKVLVKDDGFACDTIVFQKCVQQGLDAQNWRVRCLQLAHACQRNSLDFCDVGLDIGHGDPRCPDVILCGGQSEKWWSPLPVEELCFDCVGDSTCMTEMRILEVHVNYVRRMASEECAGNRKRATCTWLLEAIGDVACSVIDVPGRVDLLPCD
eukprot:468031-Amphidinium_carterae.1